MVLGTRRPVALLVFLPAAAGTRVVPADLRLVAPDGLGDGIVAADARRLPAARRRERTRLGALLRAPRAERRRRLGRRIVQDQRLARRGSRAGGPAAGAPSAVSTGRSPHR